MIERYLRKSIWCGTVCLVAWVAAAQPRGQGRTVTPEDTMYILPVYEQFGSIGDDEAKVEGDKLRSRLGPEGPGVRLGFTTYVPIVMDDWSVPLNDPVAIRAAMKSTIDLIDRDLRRARAANVPICMNFLTAIRASMDPVQKGAEAADVRNTQWVGGRAIPVDNTISSGWMTHSRYARHYEAVQEAYLRELGKIIANRMHEFPDTFVAAAGDGEVEMSYEKTPIVNSQFTTATMQLADYSPFAVAEFRDWLTAGGLYAKGQPYQDQAYGSASRYTGKIDLINQDFGTRFTNFKLRYFDWDLTSEAASAIPLEQYSAESFDRHPVSNPNGFDAPRIRNFSGRWWQMWLQFRRMVIWRHNIDFAKWITTSPDTGPGSGNTGATVPYTRWYSYQIPADRLYGLTPADDASNLRYETSASAWWTADVTPYGRLGTTAFNIYYGPPPAPGPACGNADPKINFFCRTLANLAPQIAQRNLKFGLLEWHPAVGNPSLFPPVSDIYGEEMKLVEQYRPSLLAPYALYTINPDDRSKSDPNKPFYDSAFEKALKGLVARIVALGPK